MNRKTTIYDDDGVVHKEVLERFDVFPIDKGYLLWANKNYRKMFSDIKLSNVVKDKLDFMRVHLLAEEMYKKTNTIMIRVNSRKVRIADIEDISKIIDLSYKKTREFINRMKKLHVMAERVDIVGDMIASKYVINPLFFNCNKHLSPDLYFLFRESLDCYLPPWVVEKFHEIGNIKKEK